jgi:hypothetical protein
MSLVRGRFDQMKSAPGFIGHWSGTTDRAVLGIHGPSRAALLGGGPASPVW